MTATVFGEKNVSRSTDRGSTGRPVTSSRTSEERDTGVRLCGASGNGQTAVHGDDGAHPRHVRARGGRPHRPGRRVLPAAGRRPLARVRAPRHGRAGADGAGVGFGGRPWRALGPPASEGRPLPPSARVVGAWGRPSAAR